MRARFASWALSLASCAWAANTRAESKPAETASATQRVEVTLVGDLGQDPAFAARVTSWFDPARFEVEVKSARGLDARRVLAPDRRGVVFVWVTLRTGRGARLFFASSGLVGEQKTSYLVRELSLPRGLDELGAERVAQVLHLSTQALLEGQADLDRDEMERSMEGEVIEEGEPAQPSPAPPPPQVKASPPVAAKPKPAARPVKFSLAAGYALAARGDEGIFHGPRVDAWLGAERSFGGLVSFDLALPHDERLASLDMRFWSVSALLALALEQRPTAAVRILEFVGARLEWTHYAPTDSHDPNVKPGPATSEFRPRLSLGAALGLGRTPGVTLLLEGSWLLRHTDYELATTTGRERVGGTPTLIPSAALQVGFF